MSAGKQFKFRQTFFYYCLEDAAVLIMRYLHTKFINFMFVRNLENTYLCDMYFAKSYSL